ncbi:hypothetical protein HN51_020435 [Arachis hypogaea]
MVTLLVATTSDPASINPANARLATRSPSPGSTEDYWKRQDAAQVMAQLFCLLTLWCLGYAYAQARKPLGRVRTPGLGGRTDVGNWGRENDKKVLLGIGGGHYAPRHMDVLGVSGQCETMLLRQIDITNHNANLQAFVVK